jgi:hypothetical protein
VTARIPEPIIVRVQAAVSWNVDEDHPFAPSVEGRLRERAQAQEGRQAVPGDFRLRQMRPGEDVPFRGEDTEPVSFSVAVFVFAPPDTAPAQQLRRRRAYFDVRTGETWDVFFPGYFRYGSMADPDEVRFDDHWGFSPRAFDQFRRRLERETRGRWRYSGGSDLVLINVALSAQGALTVDYASALSGSLTDRADGTTTLTLAQVIERIAGDLETESEDVHYGVGAVVEPSTDIATGSALREAAVGTAAGILSAIGARVLGLPS